MSRYLEASLREPKLTSLEAPYECPEPESAGSLSPVLTPSPEALTLAWKMLPILRKAGLGVTGLALATWIGIHAVKGQQATHPWVELTLYIVFGLGLATVLLTWPPITDRLPWGQPKLELRGVAQYYRSARESREDNDYM